jgi:nicotinate phosphoribosyltransferase
MSSPGASGGFTSGPVELRDAALFTDLYQLTMAAAFFREGVTDQASFSLFVRRLPSERGFLVAAGLEDVLELLAGFRFSPAGLSYLESLRHFDPAFLGHLEGLRFTGGVRAMEEGTVFFADEPVLEVIAPIIEAQLLETAVLNFCHLQTVLASKAARVVLAARGRPVAEFGLRRTHGIDAGMKAARSSYIAGCELSSNVLAGLTYAVPLTGTMAHSFVTAFPRERDAFDAFARTFPDSAVLLLDSYDTVAAAHLAVEVARELADRGHRLAGVRLDSGDLAELSREVRRVLDAGGCPEVRIFASGGLDEHSVEQLVAGGAPIDAFGVGTRMNASVDAPTLDMVYKLVRHAGRDILKLSEGKRTWVGEKQVWRMAGGRDVLGLWEEEGPPGAEPLLRPVMRGGKPLRPHPSLSSIRERCAAELTRLPPEVKLLRAAAAYPVTQSPGLLARQAAAARAVAPRSP